MNIDCIHEGDKVSMTIKYLGKKKEVSACPDCVKVITNSKYCEVIS